MLTTLLAIRTDVLDRADMATSGPLSNAQVDQRINAAIGVVYDLLVKFRGDEYFEIDYPFNTVSGTQEYPMPADFLKISQGGIWWITGAGQNVAIHKYPPNESMLEIAGQGWTYQPYVNSAPVRYRLRKGASTGFANLRFSPKPTATYSVMVKYIQRPVVLVANVDPWDGYDGFEEAVKWHAAASCKAKQESDASFELGMYQAEVARILENVDRDNNEPPVVQWVDPDTYYDF